MLPENYVQAPLNTKTFSLLVRHHVLQQVGFGYTVNASKEHCATDISNNLNHVQQTNSGRGAPAASTAGALQVLPLPVPVARPEGLYTICPALSV